VVACLGRIIYFISLPTDMTDCIIHSLTLRIFLAGIARRGPTSLRKPKRRAGIVSSVVAEDVFHGFIAAAPLKSHAGPSRLRPRWGSGQQGRWFPLGYLANPTTFIDTPNSPLTNGLDDEFQVFLATDNTTTKTLTIYDGVGWGLSGCHRSGAEHLDPPGDRARDRGVRPTTRLAGAVKSLRSNRVRYHGSTPPPPSAAPAMNHLGEIGHPRLLCATE